MIDIQKECMLKPSKLAIYIFLLFSFCSSIIAQSDLASPSEFLPHRLGDKFSEHYQVVDYFEYASKSKPNQTKLIKYGITNEEHPLMVAIVSSEKNIKNLETIRTNNLKRAGLIKGEIDQNIPEIAIVWLSFSVHGNEPSGTESSMEVLYRLLSNQHPETKPWLENTVVIIDPSLNPDGYSRYTHWQRSVSGTTANPDPLAREHNEPWPTGRLNHYYFDLNRDWAWATQVESAQRLKLYNEWMPHVHPDLHEMYVNSPYFFAPSAEPMHEYITDWQRNFQSKVGKNNASYFDKNGWLYFTREVFDLLYPSYGDTYPTFNGAIGMTYEQAGHSTASSKVFMENGDTLTLADRIMHHTTTALSTIEVTSMNGKDLVKNFESYFSESSQNPKGQYKTYIVRGSQQRLKAFCELLDKQNIQYGCSSSKINTNAYDYIHQKDENISIKSTDVLVSAYQPKSVLTQVLLDPKVALSDSLTYDITAWSLIYAYGLEGYATKSKINIDKKFDSNSIIDNSSSATAQYALLFRWEGMNSAKLLGQLLKNGTKARYATSAFTLEGSNFEAGTIVITRADNANFANYTKTAFALANQLGIELFVSKTGNSEKGNDLGSEKFKLIKSPQILMIGGEECEASEFGAVWYYFDRDIDYPVTLVQNYRNLNEIDLNRFNTLIIPNGFFSFDSTMLSKIKNWVSNGGKLITISEAINAFAGKEGFSIKTIDPPKDETNKNDVNIIHRYGDLERSSISDNNPGAIVPINIDTTFSLGFGLTSTYFSLKTNTYNFQLLPKGTNYGILENTDKCIGFIGANAKNKLKNTVTFASEALGSGRVIYLVDSPLFRSFWYNGKVLFSNAIFFN
ncbi:MAG: zinc carboxypeptidase [Saprospiraceae bacterium]|nr:zinc carboxypeptidase [Saprospiraceae bacterium]